MKLEMTTNWLKLIEPGTYGTYIGDMLRDVHEEHTDDFKRQFCFEATSIMNEMFSEDWFVDRFGNVIVSNAKLVSPRYPRYYNYENDSIEFDLEIEKPEKIIEEYYECFEALDIERFFIFTEYNYGHRFGFISSYPYKSYEFEGALKAKPNKEGKYNFNRAIAMLIMFAIEQSNCALDSYQKDLEENMFEYCIDNGLFNYEYEDKMD